MGNVVTEDVVMAYEELSHADKKRLTSLAIKELREAGIVPMVSRVALCNWRKKGGTGRNGVNRFYGPAYRTALGKLRASKLAEAENIEAHDEYLRDRQPEMMGDYVNS